MPVCMTGSLSTRLAGSPLTLAVEHHCSPWGHHQPWRPHGGGGRARDGQRKSDGALAARVSATMPAGRGRGDRDSRRLLRRRPTDSCTPGQAAHLRCCDSSGRCAVLSHCSSGANILCSVFQQR